MSSRSLNDLIASKQLELEKVDDKIGNYDDVNWILERKQKLKDKRDIIEHELQVLTGAQQQLSERERAGEGDAR